MFVLLAASPPPASPSLAPPKPCEYDHHVYDLGFEAFDQDMKGGWRELADRNGCEAKAADIVRVYREKYLSVIPLLYWHEAQLRASVGEKEEAISLMYRSRGPDAADFSGWNPYVDATIAFLRNDKISFLHARNRLEHFKKPDGWPADEEWPSNGSVVAGLWNCFGKPYNIAYDTSCRPAGQRPVSPPVR
jgi:hypothetical protein